MEEKYNCIEEIATLEEVEVISTGGIGTNNYPDLNNLPSINGKELIGDVSLEDIGAQAKGDYALKSDIPDTSDFLTNDALNDYTKKEYVDKKFEGIDHDFDNYDELIKELQDFTTKGIYVGYINSVTPTRNAMEEIIKQAIKANASMIILRPAVGLPQDFVAISSGRNLQNYKDGGKGYMFFTDINEHSDSSEMPSVMSYTTKVNFTVTKNSDDVEVVIDSVETNFVSGINSTSQHAYVLHTKNETAYTPEGDYNPATKKYVDNAVATAGSGDVPIYYFDGNTNSEANKEMFDKICELIDNNKTFNLAIKKDNYIYPVECYIKKNDNDYLFYYFRDLELSYTSNKISYNGRKLYSINYLPSNKEILASELYTQYSITSNSVSQLIGRDNTTSWTPTQDYGLVHKKYVDDSIKEAIGDALGGSY